MFCSTEEYSEYVLQCRITPRIVFAVQDKTQNSFLQYRIIPRVAFFFFLQYRIMPGIRFAVYENAQITIPSTL